MSATFERSWPGAVRHYHFANFWRTPTRMLCSIRTTCCAASSTRRRSYSSRRGVTGKCHRALCRKLSKEANHGVRRSVNSHVAGASPQEMLRMPLSLLLEVCTRPRPSLYAHSTCHYLMVANRMPCVSTLVRATLPRQKPDFRGEVSSIAHDLPRTESHKKL